MRLEPQVLPQEQLGPLPRRQLHFHEGRPVADLPVRPLPGPRGLLPEAHVPRPVQLEPLRAARRGRQGKQGDQQPAERESAPVHGGYPREARRLDTTPSGDS